MANNEQGLKKHITQRVVIIGWAVLFLSTSLWLAAITQGFSKPFEIAKTFATIPFLLFAFFLMLRISIIYIKKKKA